MSYSEMRYLEDGESISKIFKPSSCHTIGHTWGTFGEEYVITAVEDILAVKAVKAAGCDEMRLELLKALNRRFLWLAGVCHCQGLVFW